MATKLVGVMLDGKLTVHAPHHGYSDYDTLCGIDANDSTIGHGGLVVVPESKFVDCEACYRIWKGTLELRLREKDFLPKLRT